MTFLEYLKMYKEIDVDSCDMMELMEMYYDEYRKSLLRIKDGCGIEDGGIKVKE